MGKGDLLLSPKHGVNPSLMLCFFCGESSGVALLGRLKNDAEAPRQAVFDREPCAKCKDLMTKGVMLIQVRDGEEGDNPYRTGPMCVVRDAALDRMPIKPSELVEHIKRVRVAFIPKEAWLALGLPEGDVPEKETP